MRGLDGWCFPARSTLAQPQKAIVRIDTNKQGCRCFADVQPCRGTRSVPWNTLSYTSAAADILLYMRNQQGSVKRDEESPLYMCRGFELTFSWSLPKSRRLFHLKAHVVWLWPGLAIARVTLKMWWLDPMASGISGQSIKEVVSPLQIFAVIIVSPFLPHMMISQGK